jgi:hypothetical protein
MREQAASDKPVTPDTAAGTLMSIFGCVNWQKDHPLQSSK